MDWRLHHTSERMHVAPIGLKLPEYRSECQARKKKEKKKANTDCSLVLCVYFVCFGYRSSTFDIIPPLIRGDAFGSVLLLALKEAA